MKTSPDIDKISEALSLAQFEFKHIEKNKENPHFKSKFADLSSIILAIREALSKQGLAITQSPTYADNRICVISRLLHKSGQWIETELSIKPAQDTAQAIGSAITYGRRYGLSSLLGVCADDDDDGNQASAKEISKYRSSPMQAPIIKNETVSMTDRIKNMIKAFEHYQISADDLGRCIQKPITTCSEHDFVKISDLFKKLKSGSIEKDDFFAHFESNMI